MIQCRDIPAQAGDCISTTKKPVASFYDFLLLIGHHKQHQQIRVRRAKHYPKPARQTIKNPGKPGSDC
jgi:hypothetical protein